MNYKDFLKSKTIVDLPTGLTNDVVINSKLYDFQKDIVRWALRRGRAAVFADCGLGKTPIQLEWAKHICNHTKGNVLILAPLAVSKQTVREGQKFNVSVNICREQKDVKKGINITNYEMLHKFNINKFVGIVLDESSILKSFSGKIRNQIIGSCKTILYKLACTATPAPNDHMELGNHSEFIGALTRQEMLAMFFIHDGGETSKWRLKGHGEFEYWKWLCSWAVYLRRPSDLGYNDDNFILPNLNINKIIVKTNGIPKRGFFIEQARTLNEQREARELSINSRIDKVAEIINTNKNNTKTLIWCNLNSEQDALQQVFKSSCVSVRGSTLPDKKIEYEESWRNGNVSVMISKPSIFGFGMNWQHCSNVIFAGLSHSYEQFYQAVRRCWRFGQVKEVNVDIVISDREKLILENINRKEKDAERMALNMIKHMQHISSKSIRRLKKDVTEYNPNIQMELPKWI